jgi:hypothetical protein
MGEDAETIATIHVHTWQTAYEGVVPAQFLHFVSVTLWVLEKNAQARHFYEARGFRLDASRREEKIGGSLLTEVRYEKRISVVKPDRPE